MIKTPKLKFNFGSEVRVEIVPTAGGPPELVITADGPMSFTQDTFSNWTKLIEMLLHYTGTAEEEEAIEKLARKKKI